MADKKISALTSASALAESDVLPIVQNMGGAPDSKKVTLANLLNLQPSSACIVFGGDTNLYRGAANTLQTSGSFIAGNIFSGTYTPTWSGSASNPAIGNGTLSGRYVVIGKMCFLNISLLSGSTTTYGGGYYSFSLPFTSANISGYGWIGVAHLRDTGTANYERHPQILPNATVLQYFIALTDANNTATWTAISPWTFGSGDAAYISIQYEIA